MIHPSFLYWRTFLFLQCHPIYTSGKHNKCLWNSTSIHFPVVPSVFILKYFFVSGLVKAVLKKREYGPKYTKNNFITGVRAINEFCLKSRYSNFFQCSTLCKQYDPLSVIKFQNCHEDNCSLLSQNFCKTTSH